MFQLSTEIKNRLYLIEQNKIKLQKTRVQRIDEDFYDIEINKLKSKLSELQQDARDLQKEYPGIGNLTKPKMQ